MSDVRFTPDYRGIGDMLNSEMMKRGMEVVAGEIMLRAMVIAPVSHTDDHRGRYLASFHVKSQLDGGAKHDRAEAIVYNDSPEAIYVEFGHHGQEPYHVLASAAFRPLKGMA
jgi:hypothetical protein